MTQTELEDTVASLRAQVDELRAVVADQRAGRFASMKSSGRCPACGGGHLIYVPRSQDSSGGQTQPMSITHHVSVFFGTTPAGPMESFSCVGCGLVEFHVTSFEGVTPDGVNIIEIRAQPMPNNGPHR